VDVEADVAAEPRAVLAHAPAHLDGCVDRRARGVLDRLRHAEEGHHAVAEVLVDGAAVAARDLVEELEAADDDRVRPLGAHALGHGGEAGDVGEEDRRPATLGIARALLVPPVLALGAERRLEVRPE
jgi:hypothetical protein